MGEVMKFNIIRYRICFLIIIATGVSGTAVFGTAIAQEADGDNSDTVEEILVTGSRIPRADLNSNSPVIVISAEEFELTTRVEVDEMLNHVPSVQVPNGATTNSEGNGRAAIALRNLGTSRTLVLINGRRVVGSSTSGAVDINAISPGLIERVEVVTGGASATYGSDAMAGVVNLITKKDFEGLRISGQYGITEQGDGERSNIDLTFGMNSADGKGNIIFNASYLNRARILASERPFSAHALDESDSDSSCARNASGPGAALGLPTTAPCLVVGGSSRVPQTMLRLRGGPSTDDSGTSISSGRLIFSDDGQSVRAYESPADLFNFNEFVNLLLPLERVSLTAIGHYDISDKVTFFAEGMFSNTLLDWRQAPFAADAEDDLRFNPDASFSLSNPHITPEIFNFLSQWDDGGAAGTRDLVAGDGVIAFRQLRRRPLDVGPRFHINRRNTYRAVTGLQGEIGESTNWDVYFNYGKHERVERNTNRFSEARFAQGVFLDPSDPTQCANPANGCVPLNVFGVGTFTQEMIDFVKYDANTITDIEQQQAGANISGSVAELPAGLLGYSVGIEYRDESANFDPDFASRNLEDSQPISGNFDVMEYFGEVHVPLLSEAPGAHYLGLDLGVRYSDYSNAVGSVVSYKAGGEWSPFDDLKIRGLFQKATRAPNINELFRGQSNSAQEAVDMCDTVKSNLRATTLAVDAFCDAQGVPDDHTVSDNQINVQRVGNPNLGEETSDTWTLGFVYTPSAIEGLEVSLDYYSIEIEDGISTFGGGLAGTMNACIADPRTGNPFCDVLIRDIDGEIDEDLTILPNANSALISTHGYDIAVNYAMDAPWRLPGSLYINLRGTYVEDNILQTSVFTNELDCAGLVFTRGTCGEGDPQWRVVTDFTHTTDRLTTRLRHRYIGGIGSEIVGFAAQEGVSVTDYFSDVGNEHYLDLYFSYRINNRYKANFTIRNLSDTQPPIIGDAGGEPNIDSQLHDPLGRSYTVSFTAEF